MKIMQLLTFNEYTAAKNKVTSVPIVPPAAAGVHGGQELFITREELFSRILFSFSLYLPADTLPIDRNFYF